MTVTFCGHGDTVCDRPLLDRLSACVEALIGEGATVFYLGGDGNFDRLAAQVVQSMKKRNREIISILVIPYLDRFYNMSLYDTSIYPPLENVPKAYAVSKRNEWMIDHADVVVACVSHDFDGAAESLRYARRKQKRVISLGKISES